MKVILRVPKFFQFIYESKFILNRIIIFKEKKGGKLAQVISDRRDIDFNLYEMFDVEALTAFDEFKDFDKKTFDMIINEAKKLAVKEMLPT